jgi:sRNA-binding carbon storage regulator CsrA
MRLFSIVQVLEVQSDVAVDAPASVYIYVLYDNIQKNKVNQSRNSSV